MEKLDYKPHLTEAFQEVRLFSFWEKQNAVIEEPQVNLFLDAILEFKTLFSAKANKIEKIIEQAEAITWLNNPDNESLMLINDLISALKDLHSSLQRQFKSLFPIKEKAIAMEEIDRFKFAIDDLNEVTNDLESRFFHLPAMEEFESITHELSAL